MNTFKEFIQDEKQEATLDESITIDESFLKSASKWALANKVRTLSRDIKRAKTSEEKIDILASQNTYLATLILAKE